MTSLSFNMVNANIPTIYAKFNTFKVNCKGNILEQTHEPSFNLMNEYICLLNIGHKYYTIIKGKAMAFKVEQIIFGLGSTYGRCGTHYKVILANGDTEYWRATNICKTKSEYALSNYHSVFNNINELKEFINTQNYDKLYYNKAILHSLLPMFSLTNRGEIGKIGYYVGYDMKVRSDIHSFKYLWIDKNGIHYELYSQNNCPTMANHKLFDTYDEVEKSAQQIVDFDDETDEQEYVTLNLRFNIKKEAAQKIMQDLLEQKWIQNLDNETEFYKEFK